MKKLLSAALAVGAIAVAALAGYRAGNGTSPDPWQWTGSNSSMSSVPERARKVLYWKHPADDTKFSAKPEKTADGKDYLPVYDDQEASFAEAQTEPKSGGERKILYYRNPMGLPDTSPVPKKDQMGMDYIPVFEGDEDDASIVKVSVAKIQRTGVRTAPVGLHRVQRPVRAPGVAKPDERSLYSVTLRADSFIEKLYVNENGMHVDKGAPLFKIYSSDMVKVQVDYRISTADGGNRDQAGALQRLENLQLPEKVVAQLKRTRQPIISFDWPSPVSGFVLKKNAVEGMMMKAGDELFRIADLSNIWVIADVAEQDIGQVKIGQKARVTLKAFPGEVFEGKVTFILHELDMTTRTAQVRIEIPNPDHRIKHEMFADVEIDTSEGEPKQIAVPLSALIDSGKRQVVLVALGDGRFEPREVKTGRRGENFIAVKEGLKAGEDVVISANFLIDAESNLKAALSRFSESASAPGPDEMPGGRAMPEGEMKP